MQPKKQPPSLETTARPPLPPPQQRSPPLTPLSEHAPPGFWPQTRLHMDESPRSPLRSESSPRSDDVEKQSSPSAKGGGGVVAVENYYSPLESPVPVTTPKDAETPDDFPTGTTHSSHSNSHTINLSRAVREETLPSALVVGDGGRGGVFGGRRWNRRGVVEQIASRSRKEVLVLRAALALRICEVVLSLISFSVMAADKTQGWSGDSFDRYKEYRFCLSVNVIAFVYAAFQAYDLTYHLVTGKHIIKHHRRYQFDFLMDQILAYLIISASSASASRIDDWQSNWGKDEFTEKASASVSVSFLGFIGFALSALISGYNLCNRDLT